MVPPWKPLLSPAANNRVFNAELCLGRSKSVGPILVASDLSSSSDRAFRRGVQLARESGTKLILLHVMSEAGNAHSLEALAASCASDDGVECEALVVVGDPAIAIPATAAKLDARIVVMGPHNRRTLKTMIGGVTASRAVRNAVCPMLVANGQVTGRHKQVLVSTDFSLCSLASVAALKALGMADAAKIILYHAYDPRPFGGIATAGMSKDSRAAQLAELHTDALLALSEFSAESNLAPDAIITEPLSASPASMILSRAEQEGADLIVMGTQGKSAVARLVLGSVAEELLRGIDTDLMVVPPAS